MNAAIVNDFKSPPRYGTFAEPVPQEGEVLVTVRAAGLHQIVRALASGTHYGSTGALPLIPGVDGVGRLEDGTRVFFGASRSPFGSMAERCVTARQFCVPLPEGLDDTTVAAMMNPALSSWGALRERAQLVPGENILILGATGVAGKLAAQIAQRLGAARVVAAGRNPAALEELLQLGAHAVIPLTDNHEALVTSLRQEWSKFPVNVVLDYLWGRPAETVLAAMAQKGLQHAAARIRYVEVGSMAGQTISLGAATLRSSGLELIGSGFGSISMEKILQSLGEFLQEAAKQPFKIKVETAPLREVEARWNSADKGARLVFLP
jgi:NADPH:quinone reductase-like Zn-dependent oxidoreductase